MLLKISLSIVFVYLCFFMQTFECMTVIPVRANVTYFNTKYVHWGLCNIRRRSRKSPYYINISGNILHTWSNNVTIHVIIMQLLSNEYRRSFVEFHYKFCELINTERFIGGMLKNAGIICPLPPGDHYFMNMTVPSQDFPNVFPFEKGRADVTLSVTETEEIVVKGFIEAEFIQKPLKH